MVHNSVGNAGRALLIASLVAVGSSASLKADDTEIYQTIETGSRAKVLIVFDNSVSMDTLVTAQKPRYMPNATYVGQYDSDRIYWSKDGSPPLLNTDQYFSKSKNRCAESFIPLDTVGFFQTKARRWETDDTDSWNQLSTSDNDPLHVDCRVDVINSNVSNGTGQTGGYPKAPAGAAATPGEEYTASDATPDQSDISWGNEAYTFYSAHYMDWVYDSTIPLVDRTRLNIAQEVVTTLVLANTGVDFGIGVFNYNYPNDASYHGGRIVQRIIDDMSTAQRAGLVNLVDIQLSAQTSTPLCESTYEAYRYVAGLGVEWGNDKREADLPDRDMAAETSSVYVGSPADCNTFVILMTDGFPQNDTAANAKIKALTTPAATCGEYENSAGNDQENCLPQLTQYMADPANDIDGVSSNGKQHAFTYTIGFETEQDLLRDAATNGGGSYSTADSASTLANVFRGILDDIDENDTAFTSPSVAIDSFTRTQSRDDVFFSMFKTLNSTDWPGNIKRLKIDITNNVASLVDKDGDPAINSQGEIDTGASTYWSSGDGGDVTKGGVGELLKNRDPADRDLRTNSGPGGDLEAFNTTNLDADAYGLASDTALFDEFGVDNQAQLNAVINWASGYEVASDGTLTWPDPEGERWVLADMLHSKPLVVNYGATGSTNQEDGADLRIVVGTNGGFFHMFNNKLGDENWAFFPKELAAVLNLRKEGGSVSSAGQVYGIDASPVLYSIDLDSDGTIDADDNDIAWVYFGLRRGGRGLYALDISRPDSPAFKWYIDQNTAGFGELGQTWSDPVVTRIPGHVDSNGVPKPVLVFGAGYDANNKDGSGIATVDSMGRGLYIVDADDGTLLWSVTPAGNTTTNLQEGGLDHSVAGAVTILDSNGDELMDRIYFADTGGNIWRIDLPGDTFYPPATDEVTWSIVKLGAMNDGANDAAADRRFFNAPDIVRTSYGGTLFDAVLIGSGDRTNPNATDVDNQFYMIRDRQIGPYFAALDTSADCDSDPATIDDLRCDLPLGPGDLFNMTSILTAAQQTAAADALVAADGWRLDLTADGEKSLSRSLTIAGKTYFGTFSPDTDSVNVCDPEGTARLYVANLLNSAATFDFDGDTDFERSWIIGSLIPDTPSPHFGEDGVIRLLLPPGSGGGGNMSNPFLTGASLPDPFAEYWYREEY